MFPGQGLGAFRIGVLGGRLLGNLPLLLQQGSLLLHMGGGAEKIAQNTTIS